MNILMPAVVSLFLLNQNGKSRGLVQMERSVLFIKKYGEQIKELERQIKELGGSDV